MIRILVIDDEVKARKAIINLVNEYISDCEIVGEAGSVDEGISKFKELQPDLLLLDIKINTQTGFDLLNKIDHSDVNVIFTTAHSEFALKAIKHSALDYLLKPIDEEELKAAIDKVEIKLRADEQFTVLEELIKEKSNGFEKIILSDASGFNIVKLKEVIRCEGEKNYTTFHLTNGKRITTSKSLIEFQKLLDPNTFIRIHKSHLININLVRAFKKGKNNTVQMEDGIEVPLSREKKALFIEKLNRTL
ncbi:MAG: hypothetical protein COA38_02395 [Fluviicola sp.]|nr:MAG: hypothetical protein COA38_02395 [Fluviicola sp.]